MMLRRTRTTGSARRPALAVLAAGAAVAAMATAPTAIGDATAASASTLATSPQKADMAELMKSYNSSTGEIGNSWWQAAVALSTLETYEQTTKDASYDYAIAAAFSHHKSSKFEDNFDDDTGWWGLAWLQAYHITGNRQYLSMAETDANYIHERWDNTCGGGVWWKRRPRFYKNAIANEIFLDLTAWLHNSMPGDTKYLHWAEAEWSWFEGSGMINSSHLINDGLTSTCKNNGRKTFTYNQGVILAGLAQLYKATKDTTLLTEAETIANAAVSDLTTSGVLHEPCTGSGCRSGTSATGQSFKGIFVRDLKILVETAHTTQFNSFLTTQARSIESHDTTKAHQVGYLWSGPVVDLTSYSQASGLDALVAALKLPGHS
jgi:predicted alpha-1,6-mannanase (GH76 family)